MQPSKVVSREEWIAARRALLEKEKAHMREGDALAAERRALPWVKVEKAYVFDTTDGPKTLAELFDGRSQLIVHHLMYAPDWSAACPGCSFQAEHIDGPAPHLERHDVRIVAVSRAPLDKLLAYKARMGWRFDWVSPRARTSTTTSTSPSPRTRSPGPHRLQLRHDPDRPALCRPGTARRQRLLQGRGRRGVPHLFDLCPRP